MQFVRRFAAFAAASRQTPEAVAARPAAGTSPERPRAPQPIDAEQLKLVGGGLSSQAPVNRW